MKTIDFSYFIERYNAGEMDSTEKQWFQKELEGNKKLREEAELRAKVDMALADQPSIRLRAKLNEIEKQREEHITSGNSGRRQLIRFAAALAALVMLGSLFLFRNNNLTIDEIPDKMLPSYDGISTSRSLEQTANADFVTAMDYYKIRDYSTAAIYFNKVLARNPGDMESAMLYGVSNFEQKNFPVAEQTFTAVTRDNNNLYIEDAEWFLAFCYIKTNNNEKALHQLEMISNSESIYRKEARKVMRMIK